MDIKTFLLINLYCPSEQILLTFNVYISGIKIVINLKIPDFNSNSLVCISFLITYSGGKELMLELGDITIEEGI